MSGRRLIKPTMYLAFDYDKEETDINAMSMTGWQLIKGGLLHHTYEQSNLEYRYKLDYNNKINKSNSERNRYFSFFEEQGWEHVNSTMNGWHYFRKIYNPSLSEEEYLIYTDDSSLQEALGRWNRTARIIQLFFSFLLFIYAYLSLQSRNVYTVLTMITVLLGIILLEYCILQMKQKRTVLSNTPPLGGYGGYFIIATFLLSIILIIYLGLTFNYVDKIHISMKFDNYTQDYHGSLKVKKDGQYILNVKIKGDDCPVSIRIYDEVSEVYYTQGSNFTHYNQQLYFDAGVYSVDVKYLKKEKDGTKKEQLTNKDSKNKKADIFIGLKKSP